jgi:hypothetical protein
MGRRMTNKRKIRNLPLSLLAATALTLPALADDATPPFQKSPFSAPAAGSDSSAVQLKQLYAGEAWGNQGGRSSGSTYLQGFDTSMSIDASKFGWTGAKFYAEGFYVPGKSDDETRIGAIPASSAPDVFNASRISRLYQIYYAQRIGHTDVLVGVGKGTNHA